MSPAMSPNENQPTRVELSVVVPSYNDAPLLAATLPRILAYLRSQGDESEVVVVDDGSTDETAATLGDLAAPDLVVIRHERNLGKGAAVRSGILSSRGDWVLLTDADLSTPIEELPRLLGHRDEAAVVIGSRAVDGARVHPRQPLYRELLGKSYNVFLRLLGLTRLKDTQCGFKLIRGELARDAARRMEIAGFAFDVELLWLCRAAGAAIVETGVAWGHSAPSSVVIPWAPLRMLRDALRLRWRISRSPGLAETELRADGRR